MGVVHETVKAVGHALDNVRAGVSTLTSRRVAGNLPQSLVVTSSSFTPGGPLPISCTDDGAGIPPTIEWRHVPDGTRSIVVFCEDPDAPFPEAFVHWIVYGIPKDATMLDGQSLAAWREGKNSKLSTGFTPAAPPPGHGVHRYHFEVFALDVPTDLEPGLGRKAVVEQMKGHVLAWGNLVGTYGHD